MGGSSGRPTPTEVYFAVRRGGALPLPRATARVAPTDGNKECDAEEESPSHGFGVPAPFRQGGRGDRGRIATASVRTGFAMTHCKECVGRADVGIGPYGVFTDRIS